MSKNIKRSTITYSAMRYVEKGQIKEMFFLFNSLLRIVAKESPIYISFIVFKVLASYSKLKSYPRV